MKISNSKKELARIISENGGWREGGFATQNANGDVRGFDCKPIWMPKIGLWRCDGNFYQWFYHEPKVKNYFQITISRAEYFHLYPAQDADGWIKWKGGECPVDEGTPISVRHRDGEEFADAFALGCWNSRWAHEGTAGDVVAYRLRYPAAEPAPEPVAETKPTIEQLASDYRNAKDYADRKQQEADSAKADAEAKLADLIAAGKALGLVLSVAGCKPELVITDWRDLRAGDEVEYVEGSQGWSIGMVGVVQRTDHDDGGNMNVRLLFGDKGTGWPRKWRFIRRP